MGLNGPRSSWTFVPLNFFVSLIIIIQKKHIIAAQ
jgi:hypothetical protein